MSAKHYQELIVWQKAMDLAASCYQITRSFPKDETFGMVSQIRRAAASVAANIAEGQARSNPKEFSHFLRIARGSLAELETHVLLCERVDLIDKTNVDKLISLSTEISRMLRGLQKSMLKTDFGALPVRDS